MKDDRNIYQLTEGEWDDIATIAASETNAAVSAKGLLTLVKGEYFSPYIEKPDEELGKRETDEDLPKQKVKINMQSVDRLLLETYPNPANTSVRVLYQFKKYSNSTSALFTDITGKVLLDLPLNKVAGHFDIKSV